MALGDADRVVGCAGGVVVTARSSGGLTVVGGARTRCGSGTSDGGSGGSGIARYRRAPAGAGPARGGLCGHEHFQRNSTAALRGSHVGALDLQPDADDRVLWLRIMGADPAD